MPPAMLPRRAAMGLHENTDLALSILLAWPPPAEPRGEKKLFFLCKFWAVKNF